MVDSRRLEKQQPKPVGRVTLPLNHLNGSIQRAHALQKRLEREAGIESAFVSAYTEMVYIIYDPQKINLESVLQQVQALDKPEPQKE